MKAYPKIIILLAGILLAMPLKAQIKLPAVIGDNMVLQQKSEVSIWGWGRSRYKNQSQRKLEQGYGHRDGFQSG